METRQTYLEFNIKKAGYEILNAEKIHEAFIEKAIDYLDNIDLQDRTVTDIEKAYEALDYKLNGGSYVAKKLLEIAKNDSIRIDYYGILIDLDTYEFQKIYDTLKNDVNNYENYKTKDNRKNRQEKYYQKHPEKRPKEEEKEN